MTKNKSPKPVIVNLKASVSLTRVDFDHGDTTKDIRVGYVLRVPSGVDRGESLGLQTIQVKPEHIQKAYMAFVRVLEGCIEDHLFELGRKMEGTDEPTPEAKAECVMAESDHSSGI